MPLPLSSGFNGRLGRLLDSILAELRGQRPVPGVGTLSGGNSLGSSRTVALPGGSKPTAPVMAWVWREWPDALECTLDGGSTFFWVMKPEMLRPSRVEQWGGGGSQWMLANTPTFTLNTDSTAWNHYGFNLLASWPNGVSPALTGLMVVWPAWLDKDPTTGTAVNSVLDRDTTAASANFRRDVLCIPVTGAATIDGATGLEDLAGAGDTRVDWVAAGDGRAWRFIDEITQQLIVVDPGGTPIGTVDPQ